MKRLAISLLIFLTPWMAGCGTLGDEFIVVDTFDTFYEDDIPPLIAQNDVYSTPKNTVLTVGAANGILANDTFFDAFIEIPTTSDQGGTVDGRADGSFTYIPPVDFVGNDTFEYFLEDDFGVVSAIVTIQVTGDPTSGGTVEVDLQNGNDSTGQPFATIQAAVASAGSNGTIIVTARSGQTYSGQVVLLDGQTLVGSGFENINAQGAVRPTLSGPLLMSNGNTVRGLRIQDSPGDGIDADGQNTGVITDCEIFDSNLAGIYIGPGRGTWQIARNEIRGTGDGEPGILADSQDSSSVVYAFQDNIVSQCSDSAINLFASGSSTMRVQLQDNSFSNCLPGFTFEVQTDGNATATLDIEGNSNDDVYLFSRLASSSTLAVERFSILQSLNTGTVLQGPDSFEIDDVPEGSAGFR